MWPESEPDRKLRGAARLCPGPNLNCLQIGRLYPEGFRLRPSFGVTGKNSLSCHRVERGPAIFVEYAGGRQSQEWGAAETPFFQNSPRSGSSLSGDHVQFMCVFNFASSSVVAGPRPRPPLPLCEELRGEVCLWEQKRTRDVLQRGPPPPPKQPCSRLCRPGRRPGQPHMLRGPSPKPAALSPATGGLRCWRRGLGWLSVPGQLFARILDINPSGSFCNWCFYVTSNVPSVSQNAASLVPVLCGGLLHPPPQSPESISYSWLMSLERGIQEQWEDPGLGVR